MTLSVGGLRRTQAFDACPRAAPADVQQDTAAAPKRLLQNAASGRLRLHALKGYPKPTIFKIDVRPDKSWQITFEMDGTEAVLLRLGTHKELDRNPR